MIPDSVFIWVSFFLAQRPLAASFRADLRCHSIWLNARRIGRIEKNFDITTLIPMLWRVKCLS
jgi:hypothetical protein